MIKKEKRIFPFSIFSFSTSLHLRQFSGFHILMKTYIVQYIFSLIYSLFGWWWYPLSISICEESKYFSNLAWKSKHTPIAFEIIRFFSFILTFYFSFASFSQVFVSCSGQSASPSPPSANEDLTEPKGTPRCVCMPVSRWRLDNLFFLFSFYRVFSLCHLYHFLSYFFLYIYIYSDVSIIMKSW